MKTVILACLLVFAAVVPAYSDYTGPAFDFSFSISADMTVPATGPTAIPAEIINIGSTPIDFSKISIMGHTGNEGIEPINITLADFSSQFPSILNPGDTIDFTFAYILDNPIGKTYHQQFAFLMQGSGGWNIHSIITIGSPTFFGSIETINTYGVPTPSTLLVFALGLAGVCLISRKRASRP